MNPREPSSTFEAVRRQHLIDATIEALADVGFKATSLSQIARRANVSTGLFAHYFGDKDGLLEATLRFMAARLVRATRQRLRDAKTAHERVYAVPDSALADQEFERRTSAVWLAFWGQITHSTRYQRIQFIYQRRMLSNLRHDLRQLVPAPCVEPYATMIAAMIDGVWIRSHATPTQTDGARARATVRALIDGLIAGVEVATPSASGMTPSACEMMRVRPPRAPAAPSTMRLVSPIDAQILGTFMAGRDAEIAQALERAGRGLAAWRRMSGRDREKALRRCADGLTAAGPELAHLDALCTGRAVAQTLAFGVPRSVQAFETYCGLASRPGSARVDIGGGAFDHWRREPLGIVAGIGHWSAPLLSACRQAAPALACGNAMIFQPAAEAPLSALRVAEILLAAGVPDGLFTILVGDAETTRLLHDRSSPAHSSLVHSSLAHPSLAHASLAHTGLAHAGVTSASPPFPRSKSATVVFADADMAQAASAVVLGCQRWMPAPDLSETRVFIQRSGLAAFRRHLRAMARTVRWGDPRDPTMQIGAPVSAHHLADVLVQIDQAIAAGAKKLMGGVGRLEGSESAFLTPTILEGCTDGMPIVRQSQFAPIVALIAFETDEDIVQAIAGRGGGAPVGLFHADLAHAHEIANRLHASLCWINDCVTSPADHESRLSGDPDDAADASRRYSHTTRIFCRHECQPAV